jgi:hypothetical protein
MLHNCSVPNNSAFGPPVSEENVHRIEIRVALPNFSWTSVARSVLSSSDEDWVHGSRWPSVIAVNRIGQSRQLLECQSKKEAIAQASQVQADLAELGIRRWCEKYDVPSNFVAT